MINDTVNDINRLKKIFALASNESEGESIAAFLMAKRLMEKLDLTFDHLFNPDAPNLGALKEFDLKRLRKILALTVSRSEGESVAAFLMAKRLMARSGLSFTTALDFSAYETDTPSTAIRTVVDMEIVSLRKRVVQLQTELAEKTEELDRYKSAFDTMIGTAWDTQSPAHETGTEQVYLN